MTEEKKSKIIVDDDWKSQVEQEKEALKQAADSAPADEPHRDELGDLPEASFMTLLSMLGAQAMSALGLIPDPSSGNPNPNRPLAKHCIDTLGVLQEKTKGNLADDEAAHLRDALHQLRMIYVSMGSEGNPATGPENEPGAPSGIELP